MAAGNNKNKQKQPKPAKKVSDHSQSERTVVQTFKTCNMNIQFCFIFISTANI